MKKEEEEERHYFLANCDRKNPISDLVGYLTTACKQALLRNCSQRLRPVAIFRELSMMSNFGCFASSLNAPLTSRAVCV